MTSFIIKSFDLVIRIGFVINLLAFALFGFVAGGRAFGGFQFSGTGGFFGLLIGAAVGFVSSVIVFGALLVLIQIERNTRPGSSAIGK